MSPPTQLNNKIYIIEHLDPELGPWSTLEYLTIAQEAHTSHSSFTLSSIPPTLSIPPELKSIAGFKATQSSVEDIYAESKGTVCLLDPAAEKELGVDDAGRFGTFLFGGILGDDPPRDRTSELRKKGFEGRRLGPVQMTTDTAVRVTMMVIQQQIPLDKIPYIDHPDIKIDEHESTNMPFRYVKGEDGRPIMPQGMIDLIKQDADKGIDDLL